MLANIVGGSYRGKYIGMNSQKTINWYIQKDLLQDEDSKYKEALLPTPGLTAFTTPAGRTTGRKIFTARTSTYERTFAVCNNYLYEIFADGTNSNLGQMASIPDDTTPIWFVVNQANQVGIFNFTASYYFDMGTNVLTKITSGNFPGSVDYVSYTEQYTIVTALGNVYYNLNNLSTWDALNVFTPTAYADKCLAALCWRDNIFCFGQESITTYINDGTNPFSKQSQSTINIGLLSANTISIFHDGMCFVGQTTKGQYRVWYYNGIQAVPISTTSVEWAMNNPAVTQELTWNQLLTFTWDNWYDAWGETNISNMYSEIQYTKDGHIFWYLTIPSLRTTYVYDLTTKEWSERNSLATTEGNIDREFRGTTLTNFKGLNLWTDLYSATIYKEDYTNQTEDGNTITRTRISEIFSQEKKNLSIYEFELDCSSGIGLTSSPSTTANIMFYYSRDGGNTFSAGQNMSTGVSGNYNARSRVRALGTGRSWVFKLVQTDAADLMIQSGIIHGVLDNY